MIDILTDYDYAVSKHNQIGKGDVIGIMFKGHAPSHKGFLGFDLIDGYNDVSLLSNWGNDISIVNQAIEKNALIKDFSTIKNIQQELRSKYPEDAHVCNCKIVSIYNPANI